MKNVRFVALLLVLCMSFAVFTACKTETPPPAESSIAESSEVSEISEVSKEPERIDGTERYKNALDIFEDIENLELKTSYELSVTVGTETRTESGKGTETYLSYGEKDMKCYSESETVYNGERTVKTEETVVGGTTFMVYDGNSFYGPAENEYTVFLPDPELYGEITELPERDKDENIIITFTKAEKVEEWFAYEYAVLKEANAEVLIDKNGNIVSVSYAAKYEQGAAYNEMKYSYTVAPIKSELPEIDAPENLNNYLEVDSVLAVQIMDEALMYIQNIGTYSYQSDSFMYANGIGSLQSASSTYTAFEYGEDFASEFSMNKYTAWFDFKRYEEREESVENETTIIDGKITTNINGKEREEELDAETLKKNKQSSVDSVMFCVPDIKSINKISYSFVDGYITVTVQCKKAHGEDIYDKLSELLNEFDYIEEISDDYDTEKNEFVITVDIDTHYPVALNIDYEGIFEVDGHKYETGFEHNVSISPANPDSYFDITEKHHPAFDKEPEEEEKATPLFYKVTDANGNIMWLLGTIHIGDNRTAYLPQEIYDAFDASDAAAFEIDVIALNKEFEDPDDDLMELYSKAYFYDDDTIDDEIDETLYRDASELALALGLGNYGDFICNLEGAKPNMWASMISNKYLEHTLGVYYNKGVDMRLLARANEAEKKVYEIEDRYRGYEMDIDFSRDVLELNLYNSVYYPRSYFRADNIEMFDAWCKGDKKKLSEIINEPADFTGMTDEQIAAYEEYTKAITDDRDALMLEKAKEYLASGETVFYSVGLAHLLDKETGLLNTLEEAGYTVELVEYK